jgi:hypothetical protein
MTARSDAGPLEGSTWIRVGRRFLAPLLVRRFPPEVPFGFVGRILPVHGETELLLEAHPIPPARATALVEGARVVTSAELERSGGGSETSELEVERDSAAALGREVAQRRQELWTVGIAWIAAGSSRPRVEAERLRVSERLAALGFRSRLPRYEARAAVAPTTLGGGDPRPPGYWQTLTTDGLAACFPFVDETVLEPQGVLVGLSLANASPVFLDRWAHASHSWGIFGTTGAGKSFAAALLLLRTRWMRPETRLVVLDPLGEFGGLVRALGGRVVRLADGADGRLNPLDPVTTGGDRREKAARVGAMLRALFPSLLDEEAAALDAAVSRLYERGEAVPTLGELGDAVASAPVGRLATLLEPFRSGSLRGLNGPTTVADEPELPISIDFTGVPDDQLAFHLTYVLDWAYGRLRRGPGPKLLLLDEAHLLTRLDATADFLDRIVRHLRHFRAGVLLASQNPDDFLGRASGRSLLRNLYATAFLRLPEVSPETKAFFGLGAAEAEWLPKARLPREAGYSESLWRIGEGHLPLAIVASTPEYEFLTALLGGPPGG